MSNQLKNEIQPTVSHDSMHRLAESETSEQNITELSNGELETISGGVANPLNLSTKKVAIGATGALLFGAVIKAAKSVRAAVSKAKL